MEDSYLWLAKEKKEEKIDFTDFGDGSSDPIKQLEHDLTLKIESLENIFGK